MKSSLYECQVMHARFTPRAHSFLYRIFLFAIDLDEIDTLPRRLAFFSVGRRNLYSFRDGDFLPSSEPKHNSSDTRVAPPAHTLKQRVIAYARLHGVDLEGGRIVLVTLPRVMGYLFNPVSFYFCYDRHGAPAAAIAEVTNTFREVKPYFLGSGALQRSTGSDAAFRLRVPKHFYVSPFSDVDVAFDFTLRAPGNRLSVQIDDYVGADRTLTSTVSGTRRQLTSARLAWFTVKYPFLTLRIIGLIHWHALRLWWKKVPWFAKAARAADQRDLYRPHGSLTPNAAPSTSHSRIRRRLGEDGSLQPSDAA